MESNKKKIILSVAVIFFTTLILRWTLAPHNRCMLPKGSYTSENGVHGMVVEKNCIRIFYLSTPEIPYATIPHTYYHRNVECGGICNEGIFYEISYNNNNKKCTVKKIAKDRPQTDPVVFIKYSR